MSEMDKKNKQKNPHTNKQKKLKGTVPSGRQCPSSLNDPDASYGQKPSQNPNGNVIYVLRSKHQRSVQSANGVKI